MFRPTIFLLFAAVFLTSTIGCRRHAANQPVLAPVKGTVTFQGKPVEGAQVIFSPKSGGRAAIGTTDAQGVFSLTTPTSGEGTTPGECLVAITKTRLEGAMTPQEANAYFLREHRPPPMPKTVQLLPQRYSDPVKSGLSATVREAGPNDFPFDLQQ